MRKWLAGKVFDLAVWLDWDGVVIAPKKRGCPLGSKNKSAPSNNKSASSKDKSASKKIGRPLGSKNKPKLQP